MAGDRQAEQPDVLSAGGDQGSGSAPGFLAVWTEVDESAVPEYLDWLTREHLIERVELPGFVSARVHRASDGSPRFFVHYETTSAAVLGSPAYLARLDAPTEWSRRLHPMLRGTVRGTGAFVRLGSGSGSAVATLRTSADAPLPRIDPGWLERVASRPFVSALRVLRVDHATTGIDTVERRIRSAPDARFGACFVAEAMTDAAAAAAGDEIAAMLAAQGLAAPVRGSYRQIHALERRWLADPGAAR